jgi:hypothetical protein
MQLLNFVIKNKIVYNIQEYTVFAFVYKLHFFDKNLPSKIGVRFIHGFFKFLFRKLDPPRRSRYPIED